MDLSKVKLFSELNPEERQLIVETARESVYPPSATVFVCGEEASGLFIIVSGRVKVFKLNPDGREKTLAILGEGDTLGEVSLYGDSLRSATVETLETTSFLVISRDSFQSLLEKIPRLSMKIIELLSERLRRANQQIEELFFMNARSRVICSLIHLAEEHGRKKGEGMIILFSLTHAELAKLAGVTRETATKVLSELRDCELISLPRGRIELKDLPGLKKELF